MNDVEEMLREMSEKYKNSKSVEVYEEQLEWWFKLIDDLREENEKLNEEIENHKQNIMQDELEIIPKLEEENKKLRETIKDHQLYEEKLEHRIIEFEELLHWE